MLNWKVGLKSIEIKYAIVEKGSIPLKHNVIIKIHSFWNVVGC